MRRKIYSDFKKKLKWKRYEKGIIVIKEEKFEIKNIFFEMRNKDGMEQIPVYIAGGFRGYVRKLIDENFTIVFESEKSINIFGDDIVIEIKGKLQNRKYAIENLRISKADWITNRGYSYWCSGYKYEEIKEDI